MSQVYCRKCGGCGYIGCCGIQKFFAHHVKGKTNCSEEAGFIEEILSYIEDTPRGDTNPPNTVK